MKERYESRTYFVTYDFGFGDFVHNCNSKAEARKRMTPYAKCSGKKIVKIEKL